MATTNTTPTTDVSEPPAQRRSSKALYVLRLALINFAVFAVLAELVSVVFVRQTKWPSTRPSYRLNYNEFYANINPAFGIWHRPNGRYLHQEGCFSHEYATNSYGARDVERSVHATQPRTIVLGDSFMEGFGVADEQRLSNILEKRSGREHLNFGVGGGTSPLQYSLVYRTMAARFDHKDVLVGVLPDNDFLEMDEARLNAKYPGQYRPYYKSDLSVGYLGKFQPEKREGFWERVEAGLRAYLASYHVGQYVYSRTLDRPTVGIYSGFNDYTEADLARLKHALQEIKSLADAHGARLSVFLIPRANDFRRLHQSGGNRLGPVMESWGREAEIPVKDLLPEMEARSKGNERPYFLECDGHWSAKANTVAADILEPWLYGK